MTKASTGTFDIDESYKVVHDVFVTMCKDGIIINTWYVTDPKSIKIQFPDNTSAVNLYLLANVGDLRDRQDINLANGQPESNIKGYRYSVGGYDEFETKGLPFANYYEGITPATLTTFKLKYLVSFYNFHYQPGINANTASISRLAFFNSALDVSVFEPDSKPQKLDRDGYDVSQEKINALNNGEYVLFYFLENMQGTLNPGNTVQDRKGKLPVETINDCTYFVINSNVDDVDKFKKVYLGKDNCTNFDLERNYGFNLIYIDSSNEPITGYFEIEFDEAAYLDWKPTDESIEYDMKYFRSSRINDETSYDADFAYRNWIPGVIFRFSGDYVKYRDIPFTVNYHLGYPVKENGNWKIDRKTIKRTTPSTTMSKQDVSFYNNAYCTTTNIGGYYFIDSNFYELGSPYQKVDTDTQTSDNLEYWAIGIEVVFDNGEVFWADLSKDGELSQYASPLTNEHTCFFADFAHRYYTNYTADTGYPGWKIIDNIEMENVQCIMMLRNISDPAHCLDICLECIDSDFLKVLPITFTDNLGNEFTVSKDFSIGVDTWNILYTLDPHAPVGDVISRSFRYNNEAVIGTSFGTFQSWYYMVPQTGATGFEGAAWSADFGNHYLQKRVVCDEDRDIYQVIRTTFRKRFHLDK